MNHTSKPLTFIQELQVEKYLYVMQEMISDPEQRTNPEVLEVLDDISKQVSQFLTVEEIQQIERDSLEYPEDQQEPETLDFTLQLPKGWKAEDYEVGEPITQIDLKNNLISLKVLIYEKTPEEYDYDEDQEDED
jgi:hypothetical protein